MKWGSGVNFGSTKKMNTLLLYSYQKGSRTSLTHLSCRNEREGKPGKSRGTEGKTRGTAEELERNSRGTSGEKPGNSWETAEERAGEKPGNSRGTAEGRAQILPRGHNLKGEKPGKGRGREEGGAVCARVGGVSASLSLPLSLSLSLPLSLFSLPLLSFSSPFLHPFFLYTSLSPPLLPFSFQPTLSCSLPLTLSACAFTFLALTPFDPLSYITLAAIGLLVLCVL
jgi:hypothetical protein